MRSKILNADRCWWCCCCKPHGVPNLVFYKCKIILWFSVCVFFCNQDHWQSQSLDFLFVYPPVCLILDLCSRFVWFYLVHFMLFFFSWFSLTLFMPKFFSFDAFGGISYRITLSLKVKRCYQLTNLKVYFLCSNNGIKSYEWKQAKRSDSKGTESESMRERKRQANLMMNKRNKKWEMFDIKYIK